MKAWSGGDNCALEGRLSMQMIHEAALCVSGVRPRNSLCHQGFELINGLPYVATDKAIHELLDTHTIVQAKQLQIVLGKVRYNRGHYQGALFALDLPTLRDEDNLSSRLAGTAKRSKPKDVSRKVMQYFFCVDAHRGQPLSRTGGILG